MTKEMLKERLNKAYEERAEFNEFVESLAIALECGAMLLLLIFGFITAITASDFAAVMVEVYIIVGIFAVPVTVVIGEGLGMIYEKKVDKIREMLYDVLRIEDKEG